MVSQVASETFSCVRQDTHAHSLKCYACAAKFWIYWVFTFLTLSFFTFYGQMTVAISPNVQVSFSYLRILCKPQDTRCLWISAVA